MSDPCSLNLGTTNKWIAIIPFKKIDPTYRTPNVAFNLVSFEMPEVLLNEVSAFYHGTEMKLPAGVSGGDKTLVFEYLMSSDWRQWKTLYKWSNMICKTIGSGFTEKLVDALVSVRFIILSEFKNPVFEIIFHNCWIKSFGGLTLDYQDPDAVEIRHSFSLAYSHFTFEGFENE